MNSLVEKYGILMYKRIVNFFYRNKNFIKNSSLKFKIIFFSSILYEKFYNLNVKKYQKHRLKEEKKVIAFEM